MFNTRISVSLIAMLMVSQPCWAQVRTYDWSKPRAAAQALPAGNVQAVDRLGALQRLGEQARRAESSLQIQRANYTSELQRAQIEAEQIRSEGEQRATQMRNTYITQNHMKVPKYSDDDIAQAQAAYELRAQSVLNGVQRLSNDAIKRQEGLIQSARDLEDQLKYGPAGCDSVMLQPVGTNLYVRNYQSIGEQYEHMPHVEPIKAVPQTGSFPTPYSSSVLSGKLLPPVRK